MLLFFGWYFHFYLLKPFLCRKFEDIFDVDHFINYLKNDVRIVREIPNNAPIRFLYTLYSWLFTNLLYNPIVKDFFSYFFRNPASQRWQFVWQNYKSDYWYIYFICILMLENYPFLAIYFWLREISFRSTSLTYDKVSWVYPSDILYHILHPYLTSLIWSSLTSSKLTFVLSFDLESLEVFMLWNRICVLFISIVQCSKLSFVQ